ncbi:hypothetical protein BP00DRAFT_83192 [Aspergillus indologenus CBS 114.80]|uniref:Uncharacterized protein n=1 Tax=Aspergillus indologenus CBS 114.80 TaxID=1450541 RepID=A0A2V5J7X4_9EURO|nr:hypothetical protein BP00DRAFT_83192 [Aspergillus indologenus CBS 114.80]
MFSTSVLCGGQLQQVRCFTSRRLAWSTFAAAWPFFFILHSSVFFMRLDSALLTTHPMFSLICIRIRHDLLNFKQPHACLQVFVREEPLRPPGAEVNIGRRLLRHLG